VSFTVGAEQSVSPFFRPAIPGGNDDMTEAEIRKIVREEIEAQAKQINQHTSDTADLTVKRIGNYFPPQP
jgi:DNA repair photolyase